MVGDHGPLLPAFVYGQKLQSFELAIRSFTLISKSLKVSQSSLAVLASNIEEISEEQNLLK